MHCSNCGIVLAPGAKFCAQCGAVVSGTPGSAVAAAPVQTVSATKPLSALVAVFMAIALVLLGCVLGYYGGIGGLALEALAMIATSVWAAIDSSRLRLREYRTGLAAHPLFLAIGMLLLWCIVFPWYLVVRSRIRAGHIGKRERPRLGLMVVLVPVGCMALLAVVSATLFMSAGSSVKGIWQQPDSQLATANAAQPATSAASVPTSNVGSGLQDLKGCAHEQFDDACLKIPALQERLNSLLAALPKNRRETDFDYSLTVSREGFLDGDVVTLSGMQPHAAPYAGVAISVDLRTGTVLVAIHAAEKLTVYGAADKIVASLPSRMQTWIQSRQEDMKPTSVAVEFL
jgi:hypothetical protein